MAWLIFAFILICLIALALVGAVGLDLWIESQEAKESFWEKDEELLFPKSGKEG